MNYYLEKLKIDVDSGIANEQQLKSVIKHILEADTIDKLGEYHPFDFKLKLLDKDIYAELKSRNNEYSKYPTTMISSSKLDYADKYNFELYLFFKYTDGLYYIKYDKQAFKKYDEKLMVRRNRGKDEYGVYKLINIKDLIKFN